MRRENEKVTTNTTTTIVKLIITALFCTYSHVPGKITSIFPPFSPSPPFTLLSLFLKLVPRNKVLLLLLLTITLP